MKSWYDIYRERMNRAYVNHVATRYAPFIAALYDLDARTYTEIGCGAGNITRVLREMGHHDNSHLLVDSCPKMLGLAVENNPVSSCRFQCADVFSALINNTQALHSHGLLEHFDDEKIRFIIENGLQAAPVQIHYVPGAKYKTPSRGDERLLEPEQWEDIVKRRYGFYKPTVSVSTFNDDYDIMIRVERRL